MSNETDCTPLWASLDCSGVSDEICQGFPTAGNVSVIAAALASQGVIPVSADAIAAGACRTFELGQAANTNFLLTSAYLVFLMQAGFAMVS